MLYDRELIFNRVREKFRARDASLGKVLFSKHDWARTKIAFEVLEAAKTIVDIGIGQGQLVNLLCERTTVQKVYGVDFRKHSKLIEPDNGDVFEYCEWDITQAQISNISQVDIVVAMEVLEHIDIDKLEEVYHRLRSLSQQGAIIITVPYQEKEPLYHHDKPYGHKQSFDDKKIEEIFGKNMIYSSYSQKWYLIFSHDALNGPTKLDLEDFKRVAKECLERPVCT